MSSLRALVRNLRRHLLHKLRGLLKKDEEVTAFADDIVIENFWIASPSLQRVFEEFEAISALELNIQKTVMIPLWPFGNATNVQRLIRELCPGWRSLEIAAQGKYLGFVIGPNAAANGWKKPMAKFEQRVAHWANMRLGIALNIIAFNIFIVPVLEYVAQLLSVNEEVQDCMLKAMRRLASGPGTWIELQDMENLTWFGFPAEMRSIGATAKAAKLRLVASVASDARRKCYDLQTAQSEWLLRPFGTWHQKSFYRVLDDNPLELQQHGITLEAVLEKVGLVKKDAQRMQQLQMMARREIQNITNPYNEEFRVRKKIQRWKLEGPDTKVACRILRNCRVVGLSCRPCVLGLFFRTLWNGWPTTRKMRSAPVAKQLQSCLLGCSGDSQDAIEHYLFCPVVWQTLQIYRGIDLSPGRRRLQAMLLADRGLEQDEICRIAVSVYAIARTVQGLRKSECTSAALFKLHLAEGLRSRRAARLCTGSAT